jgi:hypothetical protein
MVSEWVWASYHTPIIPRNWSEQQSPCTSFIKLISKPAQSNNSCSVFDQKKKNSCSEDICTGLINPYQTRTFHIYTSKFIMTLYPLIMKYRQINWCWKSFFYNTFKLIYAQGKYLQGLLLIEIDLNLTIVVEKSTIVNDSKTTFLSRIRLCSELELLTLFMDRSSKSGPS